MRFRTLTLLGVLLAAPLVAQDSSAKARTGALAGMVRDQFGHALKDATLSVDKTELKAVTNDSGLFFLPGIPAGKNDFSVMRLGYGAVHFAVDLSPDTTLMVNIPMRAVQNLAPVDVNAPKVSSSLMRDGYYKRLEVGLGSFVTPEKIDKMAVTTAAQMLRDVRGVDVRCGRGGRCTVTAHRACLAVFVNKAYVRGQLDDAVSAGEVYSIEVYERGAIVPHEFSLPGNMKNCGLIAVWTKTYADVPKP